MGRSMGINGNLRQSHCICQEAHMWYVGLDYDQLAMGDHRRPIAYSRARSATQAQESLVASLIGWNRRA